MSDNIHFSNSYPDASISQSNDFASQSSASGSGISLSYSVQTAFDNLPNNQRVPAVLFAYEILKYHSDYQPKLYTSIIGDVEQRREEEIKKRTDESSNISRMTASEWLAQVVTILNNKVVTTLHGRVTIIALCILDDDLHALLSKNNYVARLAEEVKEEMKDIFIPEAYKVFRKKVLGEKDKTDQVINKTDHPLLSKDQDRLDRYAFADFLVKLLNQTNDQYSAYTLHLYAPWGAGKTSTLNFMKTIMKDAGKQNKVATWHIVDFNAWQNQHLEYPWWVMMDSIYKQVWKKLFRRPWHFIREFYWRLNSQTLNYFFALSVLAWIVFFFLIPMLKNSDNVVNDLGEFFDKLGKTVGGILAIWGLVIGIGQYVSRNNQKAAENYMATRKDPMTSFHKRFKNIIEAIKPGRIAIFIDDLDRCKSSYVISLMESLQTLFNYQNVFFIIAADKKWINACYEVEYNPIKSYIGAEGKPIGTLFIEKMFQQSVALPGVHNEMKQKLWESFLYNSPEEQAVDGEAIVHEMANAQSVEEREKILSRSKSTSFKTDHAVRLEALKKMAEQQSMAETEHLLKPYGVLLDLNPRNMKRLLNNYSSIKASAVISHIDLPLHQTALWTILTMRWPIVADYILEHADIRNNSIKLDIDRMPPEVANIIHDKDLQRLFNGGVFPQDGPLLGDTVLQCRQLFL